MIWSMDNHLQEVTQTSVTPEIVRYLEMRHSLAASFLLHFFNGLCKDSYWLASGVRWVSRVWRLCS